VTNYKNAVGSSALDAPVCVRASLGTDLVSNLREMFAFSHHILACGEGFDRAEYSPQQLQKKRNINDLVVTPCEEARCLSNPMPGEFSPFVLSSALPYPHCLHSLENTLGRTPAFLPTSARLWL
jgi:hypothetical protein